MEGDKNRDMIAVADDNLSMENAEMNIEGAGVFITRVGSKKLGDLDSSAGPSSSGRPGVGPVVESVKQGSRGSPVPISDDVLDPGKHFAISFKDNSHKKEKIFRSSYPGKGNVTEFLFLKRGMEVKIPLGVVVEKFPMRCVVREVVSKLLGTSEYR
ncbi:hypothetical protein PVK06_039320 [Gossypium arboreum]|uniref:Uncharacterized protein n=1 Tax=Gossypium arboreum TaxID=29729 RepID=A0ABR0N2K0_GOSAR|nr:hypothetical protein PVK06_039320 [Gossypium arboreum]